VLVLALDTSTPAVTAALVDLADGGRTLASSAVVDGRRHGELLVPVISDVLDRAGVDRRDLGAVAVGLGPGPFTGLRVGIMTAAALADALGIPAYGECSLDAVGRPAVGAQDVVTALTDARRREVYWASYRSDGTRVAGPGVARPAELADRLPPGSLVTGAGAPMYAEVFAAHRVRLVGAGYPDPVALSVLVADRAMTGTPAGPLRPLYLRRPDAAEPTRPKPVTPAAAAS